MRIERQRVAESISVLQLTGELDLRTVPEVRKAIRALVDEGQVNFIINLTGLEFIDSSGLGVLVGGLARVRERGGEIKISCSNRRILRVFEMTRLTQLFNIYDTDEAAAQGFIAAGKMAGEKAA